MTDNPVNKNEQPEKPDCDCGYVGVKHYHIFGEDNIINSHDELKSIKKQVSEFTDDFVSVIEFNYCPMCGVKLECVE